jgi:hypothetical protein
MQPWHELDLPVVSSLVTLGWPCDVSCHNTAHMRCILSLPCTWYILFCFVLFCVGKSKGKIMLVCTKCTINIYVVFLFHYVLLLYSSSRLYVTSGGSQEACARGTRPPVQVPNYSFLHVKFSKPKDDFIFLVQNYLDPPLVTPQSSNFPLLYSCMLIRLTKRGSKR